MDTIYFKFFNKNNLLCKFKSTPIIHSKTLLNCKTKETATLDVYLIGDRSPESRQ